MSTTMPTNATPQATITIHLSKKAQRSALLAGLPAQEEHVYPVTTRDDLAALLALRGSEVRKDGTAHHNGHVWRADGGYSYLELETLPSSATEAIAAVAEANAKYAVKEKADEEERKARVEQEYAARAENERKHAEERKAAEERKTAQEAEREAKRLADLASLDAALRRVLTAEDAAAVYAGEHATVPLGVLSLDAARERLKDALLPLSARVVLKKPRDDYGNVIDGQFDVDEGEDAEMSIEEAQRALAVRSEVTRVLNAAPEGMIVEHTATLHVHRFVAEDDDELDGIPPPRNIGLYVRMVLAGGAVLVKEVAV